MDLTSVVAVALIAGGRFAGNATPAFAAASDKRANILVIWGDDIGVGNVSVYSRGMMGYQNCFSVGPAPLDHGCKRAKQ